MVENPQFAATAIVVEPVRLARIDRKRLRAICDDDQVFGCEFMRRTMRALARRQGMYQTMALNKNKPSTIVVAGFGSPHGDDRAGWQVLELLENRGDLPICLAHISESTQLLDKLDGCARLIIIDACSSGLKPGVITRLAWPDPRIRQRHNHSTHGVGLCSTLILAEKLSRLPESVHIFGIEIGSYRPLNEMSISVKQAVNELVEIISAEIRGDGRCTNGR